MDIQIRAQNLGYKVFYAPKAKLWHKVSRSQSSNNYFDYYSIRNRLLLVKKFNTPVQKFIFYIYFLLNVTNSVISTSLKGESQRFEKAVNTLNRLTLGYFKVSKLFENMNGRILILFQNNYELRPSGGFMGSFAILNIKKGVVTDFEIQDICQPDGQIVGHIEAKLPIQQAFKTGEWRLHNANWELDFADSANDILWFFKTAGISDIDTVVAINMGIVQNTLSIIGPVDPLDFPENEVDQNNFYQITQRPDGSSKSVFAIRPENFVFIHKIILEISVFILSPL